MSTCLIRWSYFYCDCLFKNIICKGIYVKFSSGRIQTHYWRVSKWNQARRIIEGAWKYTIRGKRCYCWKLSEIEYLQRSAQRCHLTINITYVSDRSFACDDSRLLEINNERGSLRTFYYWSWSWFKITVYLDYKITSKRAIWAGSWKSSNFEFSSGCIKLKRGCYRWYIC